MYDSVAYMLYAEDCLHTPDLTDKLHDTFGFLTDIEFISKASMRNIIKITKRPDRTKVKKQHI